MLDRHYGDNTKIVKNDSVQIKHYAILTTVILSHLIRVAKAKSEAEANALTANYEILTILCSALDGECQLLSLL